MFFKMDPLEARKTQEENVTASIFYFVVIRWMYVAQLCFTERYVLSYDIS